MYNDCIILGANCQEFMEKTAENKKINKIISKELIEFFKEKDLRKATRIKECAGYMEFKKFYDTNRTTKLNKINLCRERLCPNCSTVLAREKASLLFTAMEQYKNMQFITLTTDNVAGEMLKTTTHNMLQAFKEFVRTLKIKDYYRSIEITYNKKQNTYHPHIHIVANIENPPKNNKIAKIWAEKLHKYQKTRFPYLYTNIQKADTKSVLELCKYVTKPTDINQTTIPVLNTLKGVQLKRGSKTISTATKTIKTEYKAQQQAEEKVLNEFGFDIYQYLWNGENYDLSIARQ